MEPTMSYLSELLATVRNEHNMTLEFCASAADISKSQINRWELGETEPWARYLRALFRLTGDPRLAQYVHPNMALVHLMQAPAPPVAPPGDPAESTEELLSAIEELTKVAKYTHGILKDGQVDDHDDTAILNLQKRSQRVLEIIQVNQRNIAAWREQADRRRARQP